MKIDRDLVERVKGATGPDREIDAALWGLWDTRPLESLGWEAPIFKRDPVDTIAFDSPPHYSHSVDAALALVERLLPYHQWAVRTAAEQLHAGLHGAIIFTGSPGDAVWSYAPTPALALIRALLAAVETGGEQPRVAQAGWQEGSPNRVALEGEGSAREGLAASLPQPISGPLDGWRPIADAPRDGTHILGWNGEGCGCEIVEWIDFEGDGPDQPGHDAGWLGAYAFPGRSWGLRLRSEPQGQPTRWMPLPDAPADLDDDELTALPEASAEPEASLESAPLSKGEGE